MKLHRMKKWLLTLSAGAIMLQAPTCAETATIVTGWASTITAGSALYLAWEILR